jgi:hypothetical protein
MFFFLFLTWAFFFLRILEWSLLTSVCHVAHTCHLSHPHSNNLLSTANQAPFTWPRAISLPDIVVSVCVCVCVGGGGDERVACISFIVSSALRFQICAWIIKTAFASYDRRLNTNIKRIRLFSLEQDVGCTESVPWQPLAVTLCGLRKGLVLKISFILPV